MGRDFNPAFLALAQAGYSKPLLWGRVYSPKGTFDILDRNTGPFDKEPVVLDWGSLGASLNGFGNAFATASTTVQVHDFPMSNGRRFDYYFDNFPSRIRVDLYWAFQDPDAPNTIHSELAIKGVMRNHGFDYAGGHFDVVSRAEGLLMRDVLNVTDPEGWPDCPEANVGRALPLVVTQATRVPAWIYGADRSKLVVAEDTGVVVLFHEKGTVYWTAASVVESNVAVP